MAESQGNGLKTAANGLFHKNFEFGPLFWYDNFQNEIDTWETTLNCCFALVDQKLRGKSKIDFFADHTWPNSASSCSFTPCVCPEALSSKQQTH